MKSIGPAIGFLRVNLSGDKNESKLLKGLILKLPSNPSTGL